MIEGAKFRTKKDVTINVPLGIEESREIYLVLKLLACFLLVILALLNDAFLWRLICIVELSFLLHSTSTFQHSASSTHHYPSL